VEVGKWGKKKKDSEIGGNILIEKTKELLLCQNKNFFHTYTNTPTHIHYTPTHRYIPQNTPQNTYNNYLPLLPPHTPFHTPPPKRYPGFKYADFDIISRNA
jgi:hypothetical protein